MSNSRTIHISLDHLLAEMVGFPFVSRKVLENPVDVIEPVISSAHKDEARAQRSLWRNAEKYFATRFPHLSLDELISIRNSVWYGSLKKNQVAKATAKLPAIPLHKHLHYLANSFLEDQGAIATPKWCDELDGNQSREIVARRTWRWLLFAIPGDLLLAGLQENGQGPCRVTLHPTVIDNLLREGGFAETHLHLGAALDFPTVWASAMHVAARSSEHRIGMSPAAFASPGADFEEGKTTASWLVRAAIARFLLGEFLVRYASGNKTTFKTHLTNSKLWQEAVVRLALSNLETGSLTSRGSDANNYSFTPLQNHYNQLTKASTKKLPLKLDEVQKLDPLSKFFAARGHEGPSVQLQFLWAGLEYLRHNPDDAFFARIFWQVERVRGVVYRHCIQRPLTPGLMNFIRFYDRKRVLTSPLDEIELESAATLCGLGHGLKSLEVRSAPKDNFESQLKQLNQWKKQVIEIRRQEHAENKCRNGRLKLSEWQELEVGVVLHFLRFRGKDADDGTPHCFDINSNADPSFAGNNSRYRWQAFYLDSKKQADAICEACKRDPTLLFFLRGIDICRDEHGVPNWVIAPLFQHIRGKLRQVYRDYRLRSGKKQCTELPLLRATTHVGEDFVHLSTGLRYMDEAIEYLPLRCGDRIGHGLALGIEPFRWAKEAHRIAMPREDRLFDLIWERTLHGIAGAKFTSDRKTYVEDEILRLARSIFDPDLKPGSLPSFANVTDAIEFRKFLHTSQELERAGFPNKDLPKTRRTGVRRALRRYLTEPSLFRRCREIEWINAVDDSNAVAELQRLVRKRFVEAGITIEVNPISNLLVGDLTDIKNHPLWRLAPGLGNEDGAPLRICIGSDDPLPFATALPEEYQFLYDSLVLADKSHADARLWLDDIRKMGLESRFTVPSIVD